MRAIPSTLRFLPVAALALACLATALPARAEMAAVPTITVIGEGSSEAAPDLATIQIGVTTLGETATEALAANNAAMEAVMARLAAAGVAARDLQTSGLSVNPNWTGYDSSVSGGPTISGYTASNMLTVRLRVLDGLGSVLDAAVSDGANTLNGLTFGLAEPGPALDEARKEAVADARAKAELIATAAGAKLGPILSITEGAAVQSPEPMYRTAADSAKVPVAGGEVGYAATVTIVWQLAE
jgi:uncharacterized protein YggE